MRERVLIREYIDILITFRTTATDLTLNDEVYFGRSRDVV